MSSEPITFVTSSPQKVAVARNILDREVLTRNVPMQYIQGPSEEAAAFKLEQARKTVRGPLMVEITALGADALKGLPGTYVRTLADTLGSQGITDALAAHQDKSAELRSTIAYSPAEGQATVFFSNSVKGRVVSPRGDNGLPVDAVFEVYGQALTLAEMERDARESYSGIARSLRRMKMYLD